jgi:hypothetical protein
MFNFGDPWNTTIGGEIYYRALNFIVGLLSAFSLCFVLLTIKRKKDE